LRIYNGDKITTNGVVRITGGSARGILLEVPDGVEYLRPATDFLREAVFSSLAGVVQRALLLDLFAGVGGYGLDAISRGAGGCVFVEKSRVAADAIGGNLKKVRKAIGRDPSVKIFCADVFDWATSWDGAFDVIFIDPPYNMVESRGEELLRMASKFLKPSADARIVLEIPAACKIDAAGDLVELRRLGRRGNSRQPNALVYGRRLE
jgi:16S rRNA (guanine966-N2)-methyltransferase